MTDFASRAKRRGVENRRRPFEMVEMRELPDGTGTNLLRFTGYASVVGAPYEMQDHLGDYWETIRAGAFAKTLSEGADVPFKVNHDGITLARTKSGTMRLAEDTTGLHVEADLDTRSPAVQTLRSAVERGDLDEMSFAFRVTRQDWSPDWSQRDISEVNLNKGDVSVVNYGANPHTAGLTSLRSRDVAHALRELRAGGTLEPDAMDTLFHVLQLISAADGAVDVAQPLLASILDVENPDLDADEGEAPEPDEAARSLHSYRARLLDL